MGVPKQRRPYKRIKNDPEPCGSFHNPGFYPWLAACLLLANHQGTHVDKHGNQWYEQEYDNAPR